MRPSGSRDPCGITGSAMAYRTVCRGGPRLRNLPRPPGRRAARLGTGRHARRDNAQMAVSHAVADGRAQWPGVPDAQCPKAAIRLLAPFQTLQMNQMHDLACLSAGLDPKLWWVVGSYPFKNLDPIVQPAPATDLLLVSRTRVKASCSSTPSVEILARQFTYLSIFRLY